MGYGTKALELLDHFYSGKLLNLDEAAKEVQGESYLQASKVAEVSPPFLLFLFTIREIHLNHFLTGRRPSH